MARKKSGYKKKKLKAGRRTIHEKEDWRRRK